MNAKKETMIEALEKSLGIVTPACKKVGISRQTHYRWLDEDEEYKKAVVELNGVALDFAETKLHQQIDSGNSTATIFYLKTKGKERGYVERNELDLSSSDESLKPTIINLVAKNVEETV